jgi:hypothetical protein
VTKNTVITDKVSHFNVFLFVWIDGGQGGFMDEVTEPVMNERQNIKGHPDIHEKKKTP